MAFPEIMKDGATVVGKGRGVFPGGTVIRLRSYIDTSIVHRIFCGISLG